MDTNVTLDALTDIQEALTDQGQLLARLEARPALDMQTLARLVGEELRIQVRPVAPAHRHRTWWRTPLYLTLTALLVAALTFEVLAWQVRGVQAAAQGQTLVPTKVTPQRKGK